MQFCSSWMMVIAMVAVTFGVSAGLGAGQFVEMKTDVVSEPLVVRLDVVASDAELTCTEKILLSNLDSGRNPPVAAAGVFAFSIATDTLALLIRELQKQGRFEAMATRQITTNDNGAARIATSGHRLPYFRGVTATEFGRLTWPYDDADIMMQMTPKINADGTFLLCVASEVSTASISLIEISAGVFATRFDVKTSEVTVNMRDGETAVVGGLVEKKDITTEHKLPWLGDLPLVGEAFTYSTHEKQKSELFLFITPRVLNARARASLSAPQSSTKD